MAGRFCLSSRLRRTFPKQGRAPPGNPPHATPPAFTQIWRIQTMPASVSQEYAAELRFDC
jgi:hypothetical protein